MLPRHNILIALLLLAGFLAGIPVGYPLAAQGNADPAVSVQVLSDRVALGEIGQLIVRLTGGDATMPEQLVAPGLEIIQSASRSEMKMINGIGSVETIYFYRFRGDQPGTFTIPSFEVVMRGRPLQTREIPVTIYERSGSDVALDASKPFFAKLELVKDEFYVNEVVPFTLTAYVRGRNAISEVLPPRLQHESFVFKGFREVRTDGADVGNTYFSSAVTPSTFFALKAGQHRLGPAAVGVRVLDSGGGFGLNSFFQRTVTREMVTNTVNVTVKPLPEGAPASFTGGIGSFEIKAQASATTVGIGDPISMEFEVSGIGNLRTMGAPVFAIPQTGIWKSYEANKELSDENDSDGFTVGRVRFSRVIIPEARTLAIPPFSLTYFDPAKSEYVTLGTDPIPLTVSQDRTGNSARMAPTLPLESGAFSSAPPTSKPTPQFTDVMHIRTGTPRWVANAGRTAPGMGYYLVQALFSIAFFTVTGFGVARGLRHLRRGRSGRTPSLTFAQALKRLPATGAPRREFYHAVSQALAEWRREHPSAPTEVIKVIDRISERCASVLYSGMDEPDTPVTEAEVGEFSGLLRKLARRQDRQRALKNSPLHTFFLCACAAFCSAIPVVPALGDSLPAGNPDAVFASANRDFESGDHAAAAVKYLELARSGLVSSDLFYNLGAAKYRIGEVGEAVLWMRRALVVEPAMPEVAQSLAFLRSRSAFFEFNESKLARVIGALPASFGRWASSIAFWTGLFALSFALGLPRLKPHRPALITLALLMAMAGLVAMRVGHYRENRIAVENFATVIRGNAQALTAPAPDAKPIIDLPPGSEVRIIRDSGHWRYAEIPGDLRGWIRSESLSPVWPVTFPQSTNEIPSSEVPLSPAAISPAPDQGGSA